MKKYIAVILTLAMVLAMTACGAAPEQPAEEKPVGSNIANPVTEYSSLEEINSIALCSLCRPGVMGVTDKAYSIIDNGSYKLAQYNFEVGGYAYTFRFAPVVEDISGVYVNGNTVFANYDNSGLQLESTDTMKLARWLNIDGQYVLMVEDNGAMDAETFCATAEELKNLTDSNLVNGNSDGSENAPLVGLANPFTEYTSLEEINSITGGNLCRPGVMGVTEKRWSVMDNGTVKMGQFDFEVGGLSYCFRFAPVAEDISGVYINGGLAFPEFCKDDIQYAETAEMKLARWMNEEGQYVLTLTDNGSMSSETFASIAEELRTVTRGEV